MSEKSRKDLAIDEVYRVRLLFKCKKLLPFSRTQTTWELLLLVYVCPNLQISEAIGRLKTSQLSHSSLVRFIQEQISAGNFITSIATKRSGKILSLSREVEIELEDFLSNGSRESSVNPMEQSARGLLHPKQVILLILIETIGSNLSQVTSSFSKNII